MKFYYSVMAPEGLSNKLLCNYLLCVCELTLKPVQMQHPWDYHWRLDNTAKNKQLSFIQCDNIEEIHYKVGVTENKYTLTPHLCKWLPPYLATKTHFS